LPTLAPASPSPDPFSSGHYDDGELAFSYPAAWNTERSWYPSSVSDLKAYLSTEELRPACVLSGTATLCRPPITGLSPGGILISWWRWGLHRGASGPDSTSGDLIHVGGRSARMHDSGAEGHCLSIDADKSMRLEIPDPTLNGSWTVMDACLRAPFDDAQAQLDAMLASVTWSSPQPTLLVPIVPQGGLTVAVYDDTGLVSGATFGVPQIGRETFALEASNSGIDIYWAAPLCGETPTVGLSRVSGKILVLLEPFAGAAPGPQCDVFSSLRLSLTLSEPVSQDDVALEVW
jgi:hypothetical protein